MKKAMKWVLLIFVIGAITTIIWILRGYLQQKWMEVPSESLKNKDFLVIAHRGASGYAPENTLASIRKGLEMKADMVEIDIHLSKDGEVMVIHDATLERTTNGTGKVQSQIVEELKKLDAGTWFSKDFSEEKIPTLQEVIDLVDGQATLLIELKNESKTGFYEGLVEKTLQIIDENNAKSWCILQAFDSKYLQEITDSKRNFDKNFEFHKLIMDDFSPLPLYIDTKTKLGYLDKSIGFKAINSYFILLNEEKVKKVQSEGFKVFTYTVNEEADMRRIISFGVNGIITNYPDRAIELREND
ncbi:MAG: glycerophosphoryl diester phosphodiesterase [Flammeovirgaceae bacterium]|jgi:glycerophosphoryl diester phosphodiesterase